MELKSRETLFLAAIFLLSLGLRLVSSAVEPVRWWDETVYANLGWDLRADPFDYSFSRGWSDYVPGDWPKAGFRAPLLPYTLAVMYLLGLGPGILLPFIGALSVVAIYFLGREMFGERVALYSSVLLAVLPVHVYYSGKILTGVFGTFFLTISVWCFWKGFEKGENRYKVLFGVFLALSLLARYTVLFLVPVFPLYLFLRDRSFGFLRDRYLWLGVLAFSAILVPWFVYGLIQYGTPLGPILHAKKAASYWGGVQPWDFYLSNSFGAFSLLLPVFLFSLAYFWFRGVKRETAFLMLWFFTFLVALQMIPHKEVRFLIPAVPPVVLLSSAALSGIRIRRGVFAGLALAIFLHSAFSLYAVAEATGNQKNLCLLEAFEFLSGTDRASVVITDQSPVVYFYVKRETHFYPGTGLSDIQKLARSYGGRPVYVLWEDGKGSELKTELDAAYPVLFSCPPDRPLIVVYGVVNRTQ